MRILVVALPFFFVTASAVAALNSGVGSDSVIVVADTEAPAVAIGITMPADFVTVPIRVTSPEKDSAAAYEESREAIALIAQKAKESGRFEVMKGVAELTQKQSSFGISSGFWRRPAAAADIYLLVPLAEDRSDIYAAGADAARFIDSLAMPGKVKCQLGKLELAVENPEQYRGKLLAMIKDQMNETRKALGPMPSTITVKGLEGPVYVRQVDDKQVELMLDYSISLSNGPTN